MSIFRKWNACLSENYVICDNNVDANNLARKFTLNFFNLADNKIVLDDFCSLLEQKSNSRQAQTFDVTSIKMALCKSRNSNAFDIYRLNKKLIVETLPCVPSFKALALCIYFTFQKKF